MRTTLRILLAVTVVFALFTFASAQDFDTMTMNEIAIYHGVDWPEPVALTDLPQFSDATIGYLTELVSFVANRYFDGDVIAACEGIDYVFESRAQMNRVISVLTGS